jgi:hypothetical protein
MRATRGLVIRGEPIHLARLLARIEELLHHGWRRDREAEERLDRRGVRGPFAYCFSCTATADRLAAGLWIHARGPNEWYVSSVVPLEKQDFTEEESSRVLAEFEREFVAPAAVGLEVETEVVHHRLTLEDELSPDSVRLLRAFSASADKFSFTSDDRQRWNAFLVRVHRDESLFDPILLDAWLEEEGWPEERRGQLVGEYEAARSLLAAYDEEAGSR